MSNDAAPAMQTLHVRVRGQVQGVYYRAGTRDKARQLGIRGWVRNCHDGSVEALIRGHPDQLRDMLAWMAEGPEAARVDELAQEPVEADAALAPDAQEFEVRT
ncbi:MAG: acylphosphatase [Alcanivorax sp.]|nr:acylphosphatase [Alcanivorax sp.]